VSASVDQLVARAVAATGLDDLGPWPWRDGLEVLVDALEHEADLNELGQAIFDDRLGNSLRQRLQVQDWLCRHPEIGQVPVEGPVVVVGLPRTGTTALSNLLGADPATRAPEVWESAEPCPPPERASYRSDPRIAATQGGLDLLHELKPIMRIIHDDEATSVAESLDQLALTFRAYQHIGMASVPSYAAWWRACDLAPAYELQRRVLQLMAWRCGPNRWHLRNPPDLFCLETVVAVYPDVRFVWCHRDPAAVMASVCELVAEIRDLATDHVDRVAVGSEQLDDWAEATQRALDGRARLGEERFVDVWHRDFVADQLGTLGAVYDRIGWSFDAPAEAAARRWVDDHGREAHGSHHPELGDYGLDAEHVRDRLSAYCTRFEV